MAAAAVAKRSANWSLDDTKKMLDSMKQVVCDPINKLVRGKLLHEKIAAALLADYSIAKSALDIKSIIKNLKTFFNKLNAQYGRSGKYNLKLLI